MKSPRATKGLKKKTTPIKPPKVSSLTKLSLEDLPIPDLVQAGTEPISPKQPKPPKHSQSTTKASSEQTIQDIVAKNKIPSKESSHQANEYNTPVRPKEGSKRTKHAKFNKKTKSNLVVGSDRLGNITEISPIRETDLPSSVTDTPHHLSQPMFTSTPQVIEESKKASINLSKKKRQFGKKKTSKAHKTPKANKPVKVDLPPVTPPLLTPSPVPPTAIIEEEDEEAIKVEPQQNPILFESAEELSVIEEEVVFEGQYYIYSFPFG